MSGSESERTARRRVDRLQVADDRIVAARREESPVLSLDGLSLTEVPEGVHELTWLEDLDLAENELSVVPTWIGDLRRLKTLRLDRNRLRSLPQDVERLHALRHLSVSGNLLTRVPPCLRQLEELWILWLGDNALNGLPEWLTELGELRLLDVSNNPIGELPATIERLSGLERLDASRCHLRALPGGLMSLQALEELGLSFNRLTTLPADVSGLRSLHSLCLSKNEIDWLPPSIGDLQKLMFLALDGNPIRELPQSIGRLSALRGLALMGTGQVLRWTEGSAGWREFGDRREQGCLASLPDALRELRGLTELYLHDQPGLGLPPEVLGPTWIEARREARNNPGSVASRLDYYFSKRVSRPLNEAKMILVGRGGVGKTSLVNRLVYGTYDSSEAKTDGIAITPWPVRIGEDDVRLNVWDFGGQEIMHATHQFFLTKRSLYLLVLNAREGEQDANVEYWLRMIESFGGESPVLVVINKTDEHPFDLNRRGLQAKYPSIRGFIQTDCESNRGLAELQQAILSETDSLPHLRDDFPQPWFAIKDALANLPRSEQRNYVSYPRYQQVCVAHGVTDTISQETLVGFLHDLGTVVNFRDDPRLSETHVLNPAWVTNGIYKILNARQVADGQGELSLQTLTTLLDSEDYPRQMQLYLLDLMRKFELCYEFYETSGTYLIPELLGKEQPDLAEFGSDRALRFEYAYDIIPEGLVPRFIVRSRALNRDLPRWRTGVVLKWEGNRALVTADLEDCTISIAVTGQAAGRRRLLTVIRADLEQIHRSIAKLHAVARVPVPAHPGLSVPFEDLRVLEAAGESELTLVNAGKIVRVQISDLLDGVDPSTSRARASQRASTFSDAASVVFSYSHKDEELRDQLEVHLKLLQRQGVISMWHDRKIGAGETWADVIDDHFRHTDICLALVSADFMASDYCYEIEMRTALERHAKGECRLIPVVLRACDWESSPLGNLQALPKDGRPVKSWPNIDEAWNDVARGIRKAAQTKPGRAPASP